jgi:RNA polymerase sigma-70 factor, ECF subfamily
MDGSPWFEMRAAPKRFARLDSGVLPAGQLLMTSTGSSAAAFESLLSAVMGSAFGTALRLTRNRADAEDLVQDAALLAHRGFASFEPGTNFRAWFFKILMNCYYSRRRREKSRPVTSDLDDTPDLYLYARSGQAGFPTQGPDPAAKLLDTLGCRRSTASSRPSTSWTT